MHGSIVMIIYCHIFVLFSFATTEVKGICEVERLIFIKLDEVLINDLQKKLLNFIELSISTIQDITFFYIQLPFLQKPIFFVLLQTF